jgi:hypothetical protein
MSTGRPPTGTIPTLTEVVSWPEPPAAEAEEEVAPLPAPVAAPIAAAAAEPTQVPAAPAPTSVAAPAPSLAPASAAAATAAATAKVPAAATHADVQLTQRVLADLQRQVELMLEVRLREALAPILARASDALVRDARKELTAAMRDIVSRSIARELGKREER